MGKIPSPLGALMVNRSVHGSLMREKICELRLHTVTCLASSCGQFILLCRISLVNCFTLLLKCFWLGHSLADINNYRQQISFNLWFNTAIGSFILDFTFRRKTQEQGNFEVLSQGGKVSRVMLRKQRFKEEIMAHNILALSFSLFLFVYFLILFLACRKTL